MVEGYMDVISVYSGGFRNVVASMGTSLTVEQARMLKRYADTVLISYDGDGAGQKATIRGLEILANEGLTVRVVQLPDGLDPDDVIKKRGADTYGKLLKESIPLTDFKLQNLKKEFDINDTTGKRRYIAEAIKIISKVESESVKEDLLRKLGKDTGTTYESLSRDVSKVESVGKTKTGETVEKATEAVEQKSRNAGAARFALCAMLFNKPYSKYADLSGSQKIVGYRSLIPRTRERGVPVGTCKRVFR